MKQIFNVMAIGILFLAGASNAWAVDSYRYLHVTIDTPWTIFVFLFFLVFAPMILAVVLYWRHAWTRGKEEDDKEEATDA
ncbi:MAG TPA: hypothetical protein VNI58_00945 [Mariprofundaceae bacterium]|nr:hypothetical protein [Mariprofundaceae bacterium]